MKEIILGIIVLILVIAGYFGYLVFQFGGMGECGMSAGPVYGTPIRVNMEDLNFEQEIAIPNGKLGLMNLSDTFPPKLIKFDEHGKLIWAVEFGDALNVDIPHRRLSEMKLIHDEDGIRLEFFNHSYSEPRRIYLTKDFEVEYMCLSPM